jgi:hypothetical protein
MANSNLPHNAGLSVIALNQATPTALGAQASSTINQYDSNGKLTQVAVVLPSPLVVFSFDIPDATQTNTLCNVPFDCEVIGVQAIKVGAGGSGDTVTLGKTDLSGASAAITDAIDLHIADKAVAQASTIDYAENTLAAGETLLAGGNSASDCACKLFVTVNPV